MQVQPKGAQASAQSPAREPWLEPLRGLDAKLAELDPSVRKQIAAGVSKNAGGGDRILSAADLQAFLNWIAGAITLDDVAETIKKTAADLTGKKRMGDIKSANKGVAKGTETGDIDIDQLLTQMASEVVNAALAESSALNKQGPKQSSWPTGDAVEPGANQGSPGEVSPLTVLPT